MTIALFWKGWKMNKIVLQTYTSGIPTTELFLNYNSCTDQFFFDTNGEHDKYIYTLFNEQETQNILEQFECLDTLKIIPDVEGAIVFDLERVFADFDIEIEQTQPNTFTVLFTDTQSTVIIDFKNQNIECDGKIALNNDQIYSIFKLFKKYKAVDKN